MSEQQATPEALEQERQEAVAAAATVATVEPPVKVRQKPGPKPGWKKAITPMKGWQAVEDQEELPEVDAAPVAPASPVEDDSEDDESAPEPFLDPPDYACVGLAVQYSDHAGNLMPGILQSQPRTDKATWNVRIFPEAMLAATVRPAVPYSPTPRKGCWNPLPK